MNKYLKQKVDVFRDSKKWAILKASAFYKEKYMSKHTEKEIIESYIKCMNIINDQIKKGLKKDAYVLTDDSLCIPYMFICRHVVELILKRKIEKENTKISTGHNILHLWNECKKICSKQELEYYDELIDTLNILDDNGQKFRYTKDNKGKEFDNMPRFLNTNQMCEDINNLKRDILE